MAVLKRGASAVLGSSLEDDTFLLHFDGLERVDGESGLGGYHYIPILYCEGEAVRQEQRQLLALYGLLLGDIQGRQPACGLIIHGSAGRMTKVRLAAGLRSTRRVLINPASN